MADIKFVNDRVEMEGAIVCKGDFAANGGLSCATGEVRSTGGGAGFSFTDRSNPAGFLTPDTSYRFVWYAAQKSARLWSGQDLVTVRWTDEARRTTTLSLTNGTVECDEVVLGRAGKLTETIAALQKRIKVLEEKLGIGPVVGQPVKTSDGGKPPFIGR